MADAEMTLASTGHREPALLSALVSDAAGRCCDYYADDWDAATTGSQALNRHHFDRLRLVLFQARAGSQE